MLAHLPDPRRYFYFDLILPINQLFGFIFMILSGYMLNTMGHGIRWPLDRNDEERNSTKEYYGGVNFHGMFMSTSLIFFQGEALLSYRLYRYEVKSISRYFHVLFHFLVVVLFSVALAVIIVHKGISNESHFKSVHSWIGIALMFMYFIHFGFGFISRAFRPLHRTVGFMLFSISYIQATIGFFRYVDSHGECPNDRDAPLVCGNYNFVFNFIVIFCTLYAVTVAVLVFPDIWHREKTIEEVD
ncbi:unnamed protein product [Cylicocyclus nassatus]|uniref:Cytochrome b561 domain-containing protein n=1 Tax=Cylicocyclus nassatus TaxID=53992 RepID=A0AA36DN01_CYLNA|nr:unnamed protein product [Cylicocyclus nassatus]